MGAKGRRKIGRNNINDGDVQLRAIKMTLHRALRPEFRAPFTELMYKYSRIGTTISFLASHLFLYKVNAGDANFFAGNGDEEIHKCFLGVLRENYHDLPAAFLDMVNRNVPNDFVWPTRDGMGNAFNQLYENYQTNTKNNLKVHYVSRIKKFLRMKCYELNHGRQRYRAQQHHFDGTDIKNAAKYLVNQRDWSRGEERTRKMWFLLEEVKKVGGPVDFNLKEFATKHWFASLRMWVEIQRHIEKFHATYGYLNHIWAKFKEDRINNKEPTAPQPPKIDNFNAIPLHNFHLRHIQVDNTLFYAIACKLGALKVAPGQRKKFINISAEEYKANPHRWWGHVFDMRKINRLGKRHKTFDCTIMTDSVSVSLMFIKANRPLVETDVEKIKEMYRNEQFVYELGIDPGARTWNATVRRHIATNTEVNASF